MTIERFRKILGKKAEPMSDETILNTIAQIRVLSEIIVERVVVELKKK